MNPRFVQFGAVLQASRHSLRAKQSPRGVSSIAPHPRGPRGWRETRHGGLHARHLLVFPPRNHDILVSGERSTPKRNEIRRFLRTLLIGANWKRLIPRARGCNCFHLAGIQVPGVSQNGWQNCLFLGSLAYWKKKKRRKKPQPRVILFYEVGIVRPGN